MKKQIIIGVIAVLGLGFMAFDLVQSQVPSVVVNNFLKTFPDAADVEWSKRGDLYKVEFELGARNDEREAWFGNSGELLKYQEEINNQDLPKAVTTIVQTRYSEYRIDDIVRITEGTNVQYQLELKSALQEWNISFDSNGKELNKIAD